MEAKAATPVPGPVSKFLQHIAESLPAATHVTEGGGVALGIWWLEVKRENRSVTVEWRPRRGFGIYDPESEGYGEGPREIFRDAPMAARRVTQLLSEPGKRASWFRTLRELHGISQDEVANRLGVGQANISKQERRSKLQLTTLVKLVAALGGNVEIRAKFPQGELPLQIDNVPQAKRKPHSHHSRNNIRVTS